MICLAFTASYPRPITPSSGPADLIAIVIQLGRSVSAYKFVQVLCAVYSVVWVVSPYRISSSRTDTAI